MLYPFQRPDRDNYINIDTSKLEAKGYHNWVSQYRVMAPESWLNSNQWYKDGNHPYELDSVMHYGSFNQMISPAVMSLKYSGDTFKAGKRMTTTDSLQVDEMYCKDFSQYRSKTGFKSD